MNTTMRRALAGGLVLVVLLSAVGIAVWQHAGRGYTLRVPEAELQARLEAAMPRRWEYRGALQLTLSEPTLTLAAGSPRAALALDTEVSAHFAGRQWRYRTRIHTSAMPRYDAATAAVFLDAPAIEALDLPGLSERRREQVRSAATAALAELLATRPVYTLRDTDLKQAAARRVLRELRIDDGALLIRLGR